jgi:hypothetical protein
VLVTIFGLPHRVQWEDPTGDLSELIERTVETSSVKLIAEEAYTLATTAGFRVACRLNLPWIQIDMNDCERLAAGIKEELRDPPVLRQKPIRDETGCDSSSSQEENVA